MSADTAMTGKQTAFFIMYNNNHFSTNTLQLSYYIKVYASMHGCSKLAVNLKNLQASEKELYYAEVNLHVEKRPQM